MPTLTIIIKKLGDGRAVFSEIDGEKDSQDLAMLNILET